MLRTELRTEPIEPETGLTNQEAFATEIRRWISGRPTCGLLRNVSARTNRALTMYVGEQNPASNRPSISTATISARKLDQEIKIVF